MRSHILVHPATTTLFAKPFVFKNGVEKEGLPRDSPAGLGAGGSRFKSGRPDHSLLVSDATLSNDVFKVQNSQSYPIPVIS